MQLWGAIGFFAASLSAFGALAADYWSEDALQHDGRVVRVERTVYYNFGGGELSQALTRWPNQFAIRATNPDTGDTVRWSGSVGWNPIMLGFLDKRAYLVIEANLVSADVKQYGCPEIPYVFLRLDDRSEWKVVPGVEFPKSLLRANLSAHYHPVSTKKHQSVEDVDNSNKASERSTGGSFARDIPANFAAWQSKYKNQYRVRPRRGCEHTVPSNEDPSHPQWPGKPAQKVALEILEVKVYDPQWVIKGEQSGNSEWTKLSYGPESAAACRALIKRVDDSSDRPELRGWLLFAKDPTGNRKARGFEPLFCNERFLWFTDYDPTDRVHAILTKFAHDGELVYRLKFEKPDEPKHFSGHFMRTTMRAEGGYLYFEWWNTNQSGWDRQVVRAMKARVREPQ